MAVLRWLSGYQTFNVIYAVRVAIFQSSSNSQTFPDVYDIPTTVYRQAYVYS